MISRPIRTSLLLLGGLLAAAGPCPAAEMPRASVLLSDSDGWGAGKVLSRFKTRSGVVQLCMACMALGLFILMRKFADPTPHDSMEE